jgi:SAM-dependent methyltransferases related to tRNA (uracil-5-)-methyltransferase
MLENYFDGESAARYDESTSPYFDPAVIATTVDFLAPLAGGGALELAIGTGRIALPLAQRGVRVAGIDLSPDMVAQLREKAGWRRHPRRKGRLRDHDHRRAVLARLSRLQQHQQPDNARGAGRELRERRRAPRAGGCFVIEVGVPNTRRLEVFDLSDTHVGVDELDFDTQRLVSHHFNLVDGRWERFSIPFRSVSPAELDLMARLAGMSLRERWSGWKREPFTSESPKHVSVWQKP